MHRSCAPCRCGALANDAASPLISALPKIASAVQRAHVGHPTLRLIRYAMGSYTLDSLANGEWRDVTEQGEHHV